MLKSRKIILMLPLLSIALVAGLFYYLTVPSFRMTMDVNPSIEVVTNRLEQVVEVRALNEDAEKLLSGFTNDTRSLEATVSELVDLMILGGFIDGGTDNVVMISVRDLAANEEKVLKVNEMIRAYLENKQIEATVLAGNFKDSGEQNLTGREAAVGRLNELGVSLGMTELENMTLKELLEYYRAQDLDQEKIFQVLSSYTYNSDQPKEGMISFEEAKSIALEKYPGELLKMELDDEEYEVKVLFNGVKHEIEIHAFTGAVKEVEVDDDDDDHDRGTATPQKSRITLEEARRITLEEARRIALGRVNGTIVEEERDDDSYDFDIIYDGKKYEVEVHAFTGAVKEVEADDDDDDDDRGASTPQKSRITLGDARRIALERVNGNIVDEDMDEDSYDFEIHHQGKEYEIEINAFTGIITEFEVDDED
ncbi:PepSY domain-containing protein [Proteiniclasticum sp.]|uniref:PepSY domain-containing protein n=1 Tax=Proteiniclasticum sp. TaxID=2053595 RepID=UPI002897A005|nr:PepSY domain-containing protein [Proteiniclasticum sp.]